MPSVAREVNDSGREKGSVLRPDVVVAAAGDAARTPRSSGERLGEREMVRATTPQEERRVNGDVPRDGSYDGGDGDDSGAVQSGQVTRRSSDGERGETRHGAVSESEVASAETDVRSSAVSDVPTVTGLSSSSAAAEVTESSSASSSPPPPPPSLKLPPSPPPPPYPSTSPTSPSPPSPPPPFSSPGTTLCPSSSSSATTNVPGDTTEVAAAVVAASAVSTFSDREHHDDDDDFGEFETAPAPTDSRSRGHWGSPFGGDWSPDPRWVDEPHAVATAGPRRQVEQSRGTETSCDGGAALTALITCRRGGAAALDRVLAACFPRESPPPATPASCGSHAGSEHGDDLPGAGETVAPLTRLLLGDTRAGLGVGDDGPVPRSVWPQLRTVEDGESRRLAWAASHACRQLRRSLAATRTRTHTSADKEERNPDNSKQEEEQEEEEAGTAKVRDLATKDRAEEPMIHTRVRAGRYRPRGSGGVVTLAPAAVRTVFGYVRPGHS